MSRYESFEDAVARMDKLLSDPAERPVAELDGWHYGERIRLLEDTDMASEGEEGWLVFMEVGAAEYANVRIAAYVLTDGTDSPDEIDLSVIESA